MDIEIFSQTFSVRLAEKLENSEITITQMAAIIHGFLSLLQQTNDKEKIAHFINSI